jgi:hypothetical protein
LAKADRSGIRVQAWHLPLIFGMLNRGDRNHDIAAWFGLNQGRIKEVKDGEYGVVPPAPAGKLPPSGAPGPKASAIRERAETAYMLLKAGDTKGAIKRLEEAMAEFDKDE